MFVYCLNSMVVHRKFMDIIIIIYIGANVFEL